MGPITLTRRMRVLTRATFATLALLAAAAPAHATSVMQLTVVDLLAHSRRIVAGQVQSVTDGFDTRGLPYTEVTIKVSDAIRGQKAETYTFRQFGLDKPRKMADGRTYLGRPTGWPTWRKNEAAIVFMYSKAQDDRPADHGRSRPGQVEPRQRRRDERLRQRRAFQRRAGQPRPAR